MSTTSAPLYIHSVAPQIAEGLVLVSYNWRSTEKRIVPDSQKHRSVLVPATVIFDESVASVPARFRAMIQSALLEIAAARLADFCMDSSMAATTINASLLSTESLLRWNSDRLALQQRLTADEIKSWAPTSATVLSVLAAHGKPAADALLVQLVKLAGPNHGLTPERAGKLLSALWKSEDADNLVGLRVLLRLQSIKEAPSAESVLDNLLG